MKALIVVLVVAAAGVAEAYPQFQLSRDATCTGCHISPAGGGLLNENGYTVAEAISQFGTAPEFMYGKLGTGKVLELGGDLRAAGGVFKSEKDPYVYAFPMQLEAYARLNFGAISIQLTGGVRSLQEEAIIGTGDTETRGLPVWSREHFIMWRQKPDENEGLYVRVGRFMPVFGMRFAEHPMYVRRFGGTQLYSDTYGVNVSYVTPKLEVHATGFIEDYAIDPVEHANGAAVYSELRTSDKLAFGLEAMVKQFTNGETLFSDELSTERMEFRIGVVNKVLLPWDVLLSTEIQFINTLVDKVDRSAASAVGGAPKGIVGNVMASKFLTDYLMLDLGIGHFDPNFRVANLDRDCIDLNLHWFTTSHVELILNTRFELLGFGNGGSSGGYAMLQAHYRL